MKKIYADVRITNYVQMEAAALGLIKPEDVRTVSVKGRIDTGCTHLALPEDIAKNLGLREIEKVRVQYANKVVGECWRGSAVQVEINNRRTVVFPVISAKGTEVLLGNPILEDMDLYLNTKTGQLYPNPESPDMPLAELLSFRRIP